MEQTDCSETSAYKIQTPRNHSKERKQDSLLSYLGAGEQNTARGVRSSYQKLVYAVIFVKNIY